MNQDVKVVIDQQLVKLGWCKYDGNQWEKQQPHIVVPWESAIVWELQNMSEAFRVLRDVALICTEFREHTAIRIRRIQDEVLEFIEKYE